jgi:hypothetical protein
MNGKENYSTSIISKRSCGKSASVFRSMHIFIINPEREGRQRGLLADPAVPRIGEPLL